MFCVKCGKRIDEISARWESVAITGDIRAEVYCKKCNTNYVIIKRYVQNYTTIDSTWIEITWL